MKKSVIFSVILSLFLSINSSAQANKIENLLKQLLDLPAPAPRMSVFEMEKPKRERDAEFLSDDNIPSDDAPIEDLVDYWTNQNSKYSRLGFINKPSSKVIDRLLEYCEDKPEEVTNFLNLLPTKENIAEKVKAIYDKLPEEGEESYRREAVENWLKMNSRYYLDDLIKKAERIKDQNNYIDNTSQDNLRALARVDWYSAKPIIDRLLYDSSQPYSQVLAKWVSYEHALAEDNASDIDRFRGELKKVVEDKTAPWALRDLALDSLSLSDGWDGRDDWYISLLEDETLLTIQENGYTGLTTLISMSKPGKFNEAMIRLTKSPNFAARSAAVRNLIGSLNKDNKEILEALLPWLTNPTWIKPANDSQRLTLINTYGEADFPAAVPGLIEVVQNEKEMTRAYAALALAKYKDNRAVAALRAALADEQNVEYRKYIIGALVASGGISDDEQMSSLEAYATLISTPEGLETVQKAEYYYSEENVKPLPLNILIGKYVAELEEPSEGLASRAIERTKNLRRTKPAVAQILTGIMQKWKGRIVFFEMLRQIKSGEAEVDTVLNLLAKRKDSREKMPNELISLRGTSGIGRGIGACVTEEENEFSGILATGDAESQIAMFACARLIRAELSVNAVANLMSNANPLIALAAERYLETVDSFEARKLILEKRPNDVLILGAQDAFIPNGVKTVYESEALNLLFYSVNESYLGGRKLTQMRKTEENLRNEIKQNPDLLAVYAFVPDSESGLEAIRLFKDKIVYSNYEDKARYWERNLTKEEYEAFFNYLIAAKIDSLTQIEGYCEEACPSNEFVMFGRGGGRRVFFTGYETPAPLVKLKEFFDNFGKGDVKLNYWLANKVSGLEILLADKKFNALAVWKKDNDFRVLVEDTARKEEIDKELTEIEKRENAVEIEDGNYEQLQARYLEQVKRRAQRQYEHFSWRKVENDIIANAVTQPAEAPYLFDETQISDIEGIKFLPRAWQVRSGDSEIRVGEDYYENNLFRVNRSKSAVKIKDGTFSNPLVTGDGKWVVVSKADENDWSKPNKIVRINLQTRKEFPINILPSDTLMPIAFIASHNKVLVYRTKGKFYRTDDGLTDYSGEYENEEYYQPPTDKTPNPSPASPEFYLLDAETGAAQIVKGEFRPLLQQTFRPLQPTGNPNEFWAAIYDEKTKATQIGRYNDKTFKFQPVRAIPDINLNSMQIWVDEPQSKVYFVYQNHLLGLPLMQ